MILVLHQHRIQITIKGVLVGRACSVGHLYAGFTLSGVVIEIDVGASIEAVMHRLRRWRVEIVMHISKSSIGQVVGSYRRMNVTKWLTRSGAAFHPAVVALLRAVVFGLVDCCAPNQ